MTHLWGWLLVFNSLAAFLAIVSVLRNRKEPMAMLAWILAILLMPAVGWVLYLAMGSTRVHRKASRKRRRIAHLVGRYNDWAQAQAGVGGRDILAQLPPDVASVEQLGERLVHMPATGGNAVEIYQEANETYAALEQAIRGAAHHINLEYYIWQPDGTGRHFRDLLIERARAGVRIRLLLDAVGCWRLGRKFTRPMLEAGVRIAFFLPLWRLRRRWSPHLRNHRKIVVVDGQTAFLGSQNIGDEYRGRLRKLSPWYDTHLRISGPAALFVQQTFAEDWAFATREHLDQSAYFGEPRAAGNSIVQILPTGPDQDGSALAQVLFAAVSCAQSSIRIATPYFVPDPALLTALQYAANRGVRVQLVLPTRSDSAIVLWAGRSFYAELLAAGVEIYEYDEGVLHSKLVTIDERGALLGSANMDVRSFRLNFEISALLYDPALATQLTHYVSRKLAAARQIELRDVWQRRLHQQLVEGVSRLFAPLL